MRHLTTPAAAHVVLCEELVIGSVGQALSALGYLSLLGALEDISGIIVVAEITFQELTRPLSAGCLAIAFDQPAIDAVAGSMLARAQGSAITPGDQADAALELVNVACGNLLPSLAGAGGEFALGLPRLVSQPARFDRPWLPLRCDCGSVAICVSQD